MSLRNSNTLHGPMAQKIVMRHPDSTSTCFEDFCFLGRNFDVEPVALEILSP
jgi:hypothetical protein